MPIIESLPNKDALPQVPEYGGNRVDIRMMYVGSTVVAQQAVLGRVPEGGLEYLDRLPLTNDPVYGRGEPLVGRIVRGAICYAGNLTIDDTPATESEEPGQLLDVPLDIFPVDITNPEGEDPYQLVSRFDFYAPVTEEA